MNTQIAFWIIESIYLNWFILLLLIFFSLFFLSYRKITILKLNWHYLAISHLSVSIISLLILFEKLYHDDYLHILNNILLIFTIFGLYYFNTTSINHFKNYNKNIKKSKLVFLIFLLIIAPLFYFNFHELYYYLNLIFSALFFLSFLIFKELGKISENIHIKNSYGLIAITKLFIAIYFIGLLFLNSVDTIIITLINLSLTILLLFSYFILIINITFNYYKIEEEINTFKIFLFGFLGILVLVSINFVTTYNYENRFNNDLENTNSEYLDLVYPQIIHYNHMNLNNANFIGSMDQIINFIQNDKLNKSKLDADKLLNLIKKNLNLGVIFILDTNGNTILSTNEGQPDSFMGKNYAFRDYYSKARDNGYAIYFAHGVTSNKTGIYYSSRINDDAGNFLGVVVIKNLVEMYNEIFKKAELDYLIVSDKDIIFSSSIKNLDFTSLNVLDYDEQKIIIDSKQYGDNEIKLSNITFKSENSLIFSDENFIFHSKEINPVGWKLYILSSLKNLNIKMVNLFFILLFFNIIILSMYFLLQNYYFDKINIGVSEKKFKNLFEDSDELIQNLDISANIIYVNPSWIKTLGFKDNEVKEINFFDILSKKSNKAFRPVFDRMKTGEKIKNYELELISKKGESIWVLGNFSFRMVNGLPTISQDLFKDITDIKKVSSDLKKKNNELEKFQQFVVDRELKMIELKREIEDLKNGNIK